MAAYRAFGSEANPAPLFASPFRFCFPRMLAGSDGEMAFHWVEHSQDEAEFLAGYRGILEPRQQSPVVGPEQISICLVPMMAFDGLGGRLGRGKGYYDRFLRDFRGLRVGLAFECQFSADPLPMEAHDQRLHIVVTEKQLRDFR